MKHLNIKVYGAVQGVFFRTTAKDQADKLNLTGFVKNEPDGTVYIEAEGEKDSLDKFVSWCKNGPNLAKVEKLKITKGPLKNFSTFKRDFLDFKN